MPYCVVVLDHAAVLNNVFVLIRIFLQTLILCVPRCYAYDIE